MATQDKKVKKAKFFIFKYFLRGDLSGFLREKAPGVEEVIITDEV